MIAVLAAYGLPLRGKSMPYARSLPSATAKNVTIVPGKPKMNANVRLGTKNNVSGLFHVVSP